MDPQYFVRTAVIQRILDTKHLTNTRFAERAGFSRSYWSQILNRHRPISREIRRRVLDSGVFDGHDEADLWDVIPAEITELAS